MRPFVVLIALLAAGCGNPEVAEVDRSVVDDTFPGETLRDWKDLADHVAVVTVVDEAPQDRGDGPYGTLRRVWLRVDRVLWSAPHGARLPPVLSTRTYGWADEDGEVELKEEDAARWTLHRGYVAPLVLHDEDPGAPYDWAPLTDSSIMPLRDGRVDSRGVHEGEAQRRLHGLTVEQAAALVRAEAAHPVAARNRRLRPRARMQAMLDAGAFQDPRPG